MLILTVIFAFCMLQITSGDENAEQDIRDLLDRMTLEADTIRNTLVSRLEYFDNNFDNEDEKLLQTNTELMKDLEDLAAQLSDDKAAVSNCLNAALDVAYLNYKYRANELAALHKVQMNSLNDLFTEISLNDVQRNSIIRETEQSIEKCKELDNNEAINNCFSALVTTLIDKKN
ncbi:hypothetical protein L9F63_009111 [Diploptera punctata]|uniref:Venom protein n=1 Tax=Diploptera punctata TaxID=6984 RepID=A0AAD7Z498_DIPPU|nr:hypothetical protein L9F63_009111 [Diploptera punctata]